MIRTPRTYDSDTMLLLEITVDFLVQYFGHERDTAEELVSAFLEHYQDVYDEDFFHHELSYRLAAIAHYFEALHGSRERLGNWLIDSGYQKTPNDALAYFRERFFRH